MESNRLPFVLFQKIKVNGQMQFPNPNQKKQPYTVTMPAAEVDRPPKLEVELQFMGFYAEKNIKFQIDLVELANCGGNIMYEMNFDAPSGDWTVVTKYDTNRDVIGIEEFTQHAAPAPSPSSPKGNVTGSPRNAASANSTSPTRDPMHNARGVSASPKRATSGARSTSPKGAAAAGNARGGAASPKAAAAGGRGSPKAAAAGNNPSPRGRGGRGAAR